jgi:mitochondrial fission protein ELM1
VAPTRAYSGDIKAFMSKFHLAPEENYYALLIGGDGSGYRYDEEDIDRLIAFVNSSSDRIKWLVTTSRRTPEAFERKMEREMHTACFIAYHKDPQKVVAGFLALSKMIFVTQESASMVSEGVAAGKPVVTLVPKVADPEDNYRKILENFSSRKRLLPVSISDLSRMEFNVGELTPLTRDSIEEISEKLKGFL